MMKDAPFITSEFSLFSHVRRFATPWTVAHQASLCPWDSAGKNTGVGCHALLWGIFPTQGSNLHLLWLLPFRQILYHWAPREACLPPPSSHLILNTSPKRTQLLQVPKHLLAQETQSPQAAWCDSTSGLTSYWCDSGREADCKDY